MTSCETNFPIILLDVTAVGLFQKFFYNQIYLMNNMMQMLQVSNAANKYYSSAGHHEQKDKKTTGQIKFLAVTVKQRTKPALMWISTR